MHLHPDFFPDPSSVSRFLCQIPTIETIKLVQASDTSSFFFVLTDILLYFSELEDGLQTGIGAPCLDKSKLRPPYSPEELSAMSEMEDSSLTTCSRFVFHNFSFLFLYSKKAKFGFSLCFKLLNFPFSMFFTRGSTKLLRRVVPS